MHFALVAWVLGGLATLAALGLAFTLAHSVVQPLQALTRGADQIAAGDFGHQIRLKQRNELGSLAQAFNEMSRQLARQFAQVEKDRQTLRAMFGGMVEGVVALDSERRILFVNERAGQLLGFSAEAVVGQRLEKVVSHPAVQSLVQKANAVSEPEDTEFVWNAPSEAPSVGPPGTAGECAGGRDHPGSARHDRTAPSRTSASGIRRQCFPRAENAVGCHQSVGGSAHRWRRRRFASPRRFPASYRRAG